jgi:hypothetical protein
MSKRQKVRQKYDDKRQKAEEKFQVKMAKMKRKQAKYDKAAALAEIAINTAIGISKAFAQTGILGGPAGAAVIGAMGAAQAATVAARPLPEVPEFAEGAVRLTPEGVVEGPGGPREDHVPARLEGAPIRVSAGESIINAASTAAAPTALEAINAGEREARMIEEMAVAGGAEVRTVAEGKVGIATGKLHESMGDLKRRAAERPEIKPVPPAVRQGARGGEGKRFDDGAMLEVLQRVEQSVSRQTRRLEEQTERLEAVERTAKVDPGQAREALDRYDADQAYTGH